MDRIDENQKSILDVVIGKTPITLDGERETNRGGHTNLGRLITSAMLEETGADIALTNGGGIRATIEKGDITKGDVSMYCPLATTSSPSRSKARISSTPSTSAWTSAQAGSPTLPA